MVEGYNYNNKKLEQDIKTLKAAAFDLTGTINDGIAKIKADVQAKMEQGEELAADQDELIVIGDSYNCVENITSLIGALEDVVQRCDTLQAGKTIEASQEITNEVQEEATQELPQAEETVAELPKVEETVTELPKVEETPVVEEPVVELPKVEENVVEQPKVEATPVVEEPVVELPKVEENVVEQPKEEAPVISGSMFDAVPATENVEQPKVEVVPVPSASSIDDTPLISGSMFDAVPEQTQEPAVVNNELPKVEATDGKKTIERTSAEDERGIIISEKQMNMSRASKPSQEIILNEALNNKTTAEQPKVEEPAKEEAPVNSDFASMMSEFAELAKQQGATEDNGLSQDMFAAPKVQQLVKTTA